jgi:hypothetical protein
MASALNTPIQVFNIYDQSYLTTTFTHLHKETTIVKLEGLYKSILEENIKAPFTTNKLK